MSNEIRNFFRNFKQYPALGIALAIGAVAVLFYIYKSNQSNSAAAQQSNTNTTPVLYQFEVTPPGPSSAPTQPSSPPTQTPPSTPAPPPSTPTPPPSKPTPPPSKPTPPPVSQPQPQYITVTRWPSQNSTLSGIAQSAGVSLAQVESLNPQYKGNYNLIYAGQKVRVR